MYSGTTWAQLGPTKILVRPFQTRCFTSIPTLILATFIYNYKNYIIINDVMLTISKGWIQKMANCSINCHRKKMAVNECWISVEVKKGVLQPPSSIIATYGILNSSFVSYIDKFVNQS